MSSHYPLFERARTRASLVLLMATLGVSLSLSQAEVLIDGRPSVRFENQSARFIVDLAGGSFREFALRDHPVNPLHWGHPQPGNVSPKVMGHFLCLDRWGPPSEAEGKNGMPYHGEAGRVIWDIDEDVHDHDGLLHGMLSAHLPMAGLRIHRSIQMPADQALVVIEETVTNENALGRPYNMVQHPSIGPPFLTRNTVVDANGRRGFAQGGSLPNPEEPSAYWPQAVNRDGERVNLRHLHEDHDPNVASFAIDESIGWVTAATPEHGLLIAYLWPTADYPWLDIWRNVVDGEPQARGLEFGTTGLHQPFPILMEKGRIFGRRLFEYLDAGESATKRFATFLLKIPSDYTGVGAIEIGPTAITITERANGRNRSHTIPLNGIELDW